MLSNGEIVATTDRLTSIMLQRSRLDKVLGCVADYRDNLASRMREGSDRIPENDAATCLDHVPNETVDHGQ